MTKRSIKQSERSPALVERLSESPALFSRKIQRFRFGILASVLTLVAAVFFVAAGTSVATDSGDPVLGPLLLAIVVAAIGFALASLLIFPDHEADQIASQLVADADGRRLLARWLHRTRFFRNLGGLAGLGLWPTTWTNGGNGSTILVFGMGGILVGAIASEAHRTQSTQGVRTVSLAPRQVRDYLVNRDQRRAIALVGIWIATTTAALSSGSSRVVLVLLALALVTLGGVRILQWQIATRPRPSLAPALRRADDLVRELAITRSLAQPANAFVAALLVPAFQGLAGTRFDAWADPLVLVAWVTALWWWAKNKRLGLDWLLDGADEAAVAPSFETSGRS